MQMEFAVKYFSSYMHEVKVFLSDFEDALVTARFLSTISDVRFASVYQVRPGSRDDISAHALLCQFQHGRLHKQYPLAEMLIKKAGRYVALSPFLASRYH